MRLIRTPLLVALVLGLLGVVPSAAVADPAWKLDIHHNETNFPPGGTAEYWLNVENIGDTDTAGVVTVTVDLPGGLTGSFVRSLSVGSYGTPPGTGTAVWSCPGVTGASDITCTTATPIPRHSISRSLVLTVEVAPGASGERLTTATVSGGGAPAPAGAVEIIRIDSTPAGFGIVPGSWVADFYEADAKTTVRQAGEHPDNLYVSFDLNSIAAPLPGDPHQKQAVSTLRNVQVDLPPGFLGAPTAVEECTAAQFSLAKCPASSQVGRADLRIYPIDDADFAALTAGVFNMVHPRGSVTDLAFAPLGASVHVKASLDPANAYAIRTRVSHIPEALPAFYSNTTIWGVPADPSHDSERCFEFSDFYGGNTDKECPAGIPPKPFLTVPARCDGDSPIRLSGYDSWDDPGVFGPDQVYELPGQFQRCDRLRFEPSVSLTPTGSQANSPTGLDVTISVPQSEDPNTLTTPPVKSTVVTFPQGMTFNPAFADGLDGCTMDQFGISQDGTPNGAPVACPDNSRIGEVSLTTPLLPEPVVGSMYLAEPLANPCGNSNFALYMAVRDTEQRGILVKIPGCISLDERTGQVTTSFDDLPQFPFEDFTLSFRSGQRAPLVTPAECGTQTIGIQVASYAQPDDLIDASTSFEIDEGPGGGPCPGGLGDRPFDPDLAAGSINPVAGAFSPFHLRLTRDDADQEFARFEGTPPPGVAAKLAGIEYCPESTIDSIPTGLGTARGEIDDPSCPSESLIGTVSSGVGSGQNPNYFNGNVYLAGPYKGAPISGVAVVPGLTGPYDLGNVVVRTPAHFDPRTARVRFVADEVPKIVHGVLLRIRDIRVKLDRPDFTNNPTSCREKRVETVITGVGADLFSTSDDSTAEVSNRYQVGDCGSLGFRPHLFLRLFGRKFTRSTNPRFRAVLVPREGDANIARSAVLMPSSLFLDQDHIRTICTRAQFATDTCPSRAVYGRAVATTPLLDEPLRGPVYLRSSDNPLPDLVADLRGQVRVEVVGRTDSVNGALRNIFDVVPDAPVEKFVLHLAGGRKGLLVASRNLCAGAQRARVNLLGHNGRRSLTRPRIRIPCGKRRGGKRKGNRRGARRASISGARAVR